MGVQKIAQRYRARLIIVRIKADILLGRRYGLLRELDLLIRLLQLAPELPLIYYTAKMMSLSTPKKFRFATKLSYLTHFNWIILLFH